MEFTFPGILVKLSSVSKSGEEPMKNLGIKATFVDPKDFADNFHIIDVTRTFRQPVDWEKISFTVGRRVNVKLGDLEFSAMLKGFSVKKKVTEQGDSFDFNFTLEKSLEPNQDHILSSVYLKRKEPDPETGKSKFVLNEVSFTV